MNNPQKTLKYSLGIGLLIFISILLYPKFLTLFHEPIPENFFYHIQAKKLGKEMVEGFKGKAKCLIIHRPLNSHDMVAFEKLKAALEEGLGETVEECLCEPILDFDKIEGHVEEAMVGITAEDFNRALKKHPECDIVISLVPLPYDEKELYKIDILKMIQEPENSGVWVRDPHQKYPRLGILNGDIGNLEPVFYEGLIHAMTIWTENPVVKSKYSEDERNNAFDLRYLMVTPKSIESLRALYPKLFPMRR